MQYGSPGDKLLIHSMDRAGLDALVLVAVRVVPLLERFLVLHGLALPLTARVEVGDFDFLALHGFHVLGYSAGVGIYEGGEAPFWSTSPAS